MRTPNPKNSSSNEFAATRNEMIEQINHARVDEDPGTHPDHEHVGAILRLSESMENHAVTKMKIRK